MTNSLATASSILDWHAEEEWARLRTHLELTSGSWTAFVFAATPAVVDVLRDRTTAFLRSHSRTVHHLRPESAAALASLTETLLSDLHDSTACMWIDAMHEGGEWVAAREALFVRLNEHRDALLRHLPGGVLFALPRETKARVREIAPDLWSIRSIVLHLYPVASAEAVAFPLGAAMALEGQPAEGTPEQARLALLEARRLLAREDFERASELFVRAARELLGSGQIGAARDAVETALRLASVHLPQLPPETLALFGEIELADGDSAAAIDHLRRAIDAAGDAARPYWLVVLARAYEVQGELVDAATTFLQASSLFQNGGALTSSAQVLLEVGDLEWALYGPERARGRYEEVVAVLRQAITKDSPDETIVTALMSGLLQLASLHRIEGEVEQARLLVEECLASRAFLQSDDQASQGVTQAVAVAHLFLGKIAFESGDLVSALQESNAAIDVAARLKSLVRHADIDSQAHLTLAKVAAAKDDPSTTRDHAAAAVAVWRTAISRTGEQPEALMRTVRALTLAAEYMEDAVAEQLLNEAVLLQKRIVASAGPAAYSLRLLEAVLEQLGLFLVMRKGEPQEARLKFQEQVATIRQLETLEPARRDIQQRMLWALFNLGLSQAQTDDRAAAYATFRELAKRLRQLLNHQDGRPSDLSLLGRTIENLLKLAQNLDPAAVPELRAEAEALEKRLPQP
ncbi:MAG TPA: hypothetical protein VGF48_17670 [Thermoanaerobaculia bacterium]|jgi:tetratricopeptide (TPR) repeat protein